MVSIVVWGSGPTLFGPFPLCRIREDPIRNSPFTGLKTVARYQTPNHRSLQRRTGTTSTVYSRMWGGALLSRSTDPTPLFTLRIGNQNGAPRNGGRVSLLPYPSLQGRSSGTLKYGGKDLGG